MAYNLPRILLVDDEAENLKALERTLRGRFEVHSFTSPKEALDALARADFAVLVSDQRMPEMPGTELLAKAARTHPLVTRVILTAYTETRELLDAINRAEIYRYITKPWDNDELPGIIHQAAEHHRLQRENAELVHRLEGTNQELEKEVERRTAELKQANRKLNELAMTDPLTRVMNRRAFFHRFREEVERSKRYGHRMVLVMVDVDHFKPFNDMEGHVYGDEALKRVAQIFTSNLRTSDLLGRYGGEEFIVLMPETAVKDAMEICERLRATVEATSFQGGKGPAYLTVSIGIAGYPKEGETPETLLKSADQALYQAKERGRNRVVHQQEKDESFFLR